MDNAMTQSSTYPGGVIGTKILQGEEMDPQIFKSETQDMQSNMENVLQTAELMPRGFAQPMALIGQLKQDIANLTPQSSLQDFVRIGGEIHSLHLIAARAYYAGGALNDSPSLETLSNLSVLTSGMSAISDSKSAKDWQEAVSELSSGVGQLSSLQSSLPNDYSAFHEMWQNWMSEGQQPSSMGYMIQALQQLQSDFLLTQQ